MLVTFYLCAFHVLLASSSTGPSLSRTSSTSSSGHGSSSFSSSGRIVGESGIYPPHRRPQVNLATKSKVWDRHRVEQSRTNSALRAHTAVLTTAGHATAGVVRAGIQHVGNQMNKQATAEQKIYSKKVLQDAKKNLISAPKEVFKEASETLHNSRVRKKIVRKDYQTARKGGNPVHQRPYTYQENNKLASNYHHQNTQFYQKVHAQNHDLSHPGSSKGHAIGYPINS